MLIEIDESLKKYIEENISKLNESSKEIETLEEIARSYYKEKHIIIGKREVLLYFSKLHLLGQKVRNIYNNLYNNVSQYYKVYKNQFIVYVKILSNENQFKKTIEDNKHVYEVPIEYFYDNAFLTETALVTENLRDAWLYKAMVKKYIKETIDINLQIELEYINGGGADSYTTYEEEIKKNKLVLCIVDSDKKFPQDKIGNTAKNVDSIYKKYEKNKITRVYKLGVREKENLVPPSFYILCTHTGNDKALKRLLNIEKEGAEACEFLKYMDMKHGIKIDTLKEGDYKNYLDKIIEDYQGLIGCDGDEETVQDNKHILGIGSKAIETFREEILEDNLDNILKEKEKEKEEHNSPSIESEIEILKEKKLKKQKLFAYLPEYIEEEWYDLCNIILAWGCANSFSSTNKVKEYIK